MCGDCDGGMVARMEGSWVPAYQGALSPSTLYR